MNPLHQLRNMALGHLLVTAGGTSLAFRLGGSGAALSFGLGAGVILASTLLLGWAAQRVFAQKSVAWTVAAIISKYAILLSSISYLTRTTWFDVTAGGLGIASFVLTALGLAVFTSEKESLRGGSTF